MTGLDYMPPLQGAIDHARLWVSYVNACRSELKSKHAEQEAIARAENMVRVAVQLGEMLPLTWRAILLALFRPTLKPWISVNEFETLRQQTRQLFFAVREAMDGAHQIAQSLQELTGRMPEAANGLLTLIDSACQLEESIFRDWPSFADTSPPESCANAIPPDAALAEALGISVEKAREKMDARKRELGATRE